MKNYITFWRAQKNITRVDLAQSLSVSANTIRRYEIGERDGSMDTYSKIATTLNVTVDELMNGPQKPVYDTDGNTWIHGRTLNHVRMVKGFSLNDFSRLIGISPKALEGAEQMSFKVSRNSAEKIADVLGITVAEINDNTPDLYENEHKIRRIHPGVHAEHHTICSFCGFTNKKDVLSCENCKQPLTGTKILILSPETPAAPIEKTYIVPNHSASDNEKRRRIQDICWKLSGETLDHLYNTATICETCAQAIAGPEKNIRKSS